MSNNAMSNETDLDWLARNVHEWHEGANYVCVNHTDGGYVFHEHNRNCAIWFTKDQWLARRAELQSVTEQFKPSIEEANRLAQEFKLLTSIEDNQEQDMKQDNGWFERKAQEAEDLAFKVVSLLREDAGLFSTVEISDLNELTDAELTKRDAAACGGQKYLYSHWFERGELPPVGVFCEAYIDRPPQWIEAEIVAHKDGFAIGWCKSVMKGCHGDKASEFRPILNERDVLMSVLECYSGALPKEHQRSEVADAILSAGFKLEAK